MQFDRITLVCLLSVAALAAGCASAPTATLRIPTASMVGCEEIDTELASASEVRREALARQENAWKAVVPFAVAARYASGKTAVAEADIWLAELQTESARRGCRSRG